MWGWFWGKDWRKTQVALDDLKLHTDIHRMMMRDEYDFSKATPFHYGHRRRWDMGRPLTWCVRCGRHRLKERLEQTVGVGEWQCRDQQECLGRRLDGLEKGHNKLDRTVERNQDGRAAWEDRYRGQIENLKTDMATVQQSVSSLKNSATVVKWGLGQPPACQRCGLQHLNCSG